jgi:uncharacterized protein YcnI
MKLVKFAPIVLILILSVTAVMAAHTATVSISPKEIPMGMVEDISLNVMNTGADNIVMVELVIPEENQKPLYLVEEVSRPEGWTYEIRQRTNQAYPYKITWTTAGSGIANGESLDFGLTAQAPSEGGSYDLDWITTDTKGSIRGGTITTKVGLAPLASLKVVTASKVSAGNSLSVSVFAYDSVGRIKSDYTGTVSFSSTDEKAILPATYTFSTADNGYRIFTAKLKTVGSQTVIVEDKTNKLSASSSVNVAVGKLISLDVAPELSAVNAGEKTVFSAMASDIYGNQIDVTDETDWNIDSEAGGKWNKNIYTAGNEGIWTVEGKYSTLSDGAELAVGEAVAPVEIPVEVPEEIPIEEEIVTPVEEEPVTPTVALSITGDDSIAITPGGNDTTVLTVSNDGDTKLTGVEVGVAGVPSDWVLIFPLSSDIEAGESKDFLLIVYVPENETESQTMTLTATSSEGATAEKEVTLSLGVPPTGLFEAIPKNILQLGVVIIAVAAVVIIGWELWFKK